MTAVWSAACRVALHRLGVRFAAVVSVVAALSVLIVAALERRASPPTAVDNTLLGIVFGLGIPLCSYATLGRITTSWGLAESTDILARYGVSRRLSALGFVLVAGSFSGLVGIALALVAVLATGSTSYPSFAADAVISARIGLMAGVAYSTWFALGSTLGRRGGGRFVALALDWILGSSTTAVALPFPRAHVRNLLGAEPLLEMTQRQASLALVVLAAVYIAFAIWRTPP